MDVKTLRASPPVALALFLAVSAAVSGVRALLARPLAGPDLTSPSTFAPDLNTAPERHLLLLPGIGPVRARAIVEERERCGPFGCVSDLGRVKGIGPATTAAIGALVRVRAAEGPTEGDP